MKTPQNVSFLERGIRSLVDSNDKAYRLRVLMADVVVGQFLEGAVMRGGGALKLRYGNAATRIAHQIAQKNTWTHSTTFCAGAGYYRPPAYYFPRECGLSGT